MNALYHTRSDQLHGTSYSEVARHARAIYGKIKAKTKRKPYVRSAYFKKQKVFFDFFWEHLHQKTPRDRFRRLKCFAAAVELIQKSRCHPVSLDNPHKPGEILHRFVGITPGGQMFYVQIKEEKQSGQKHFMSCFPAT